ncbi:MAG TPA: response regulator transcription factor, partial [Aggregatilineales bacterium]|nr:response regulator transcription factor [Aggregatilineales bacterium]
MKTLTTRVLIVDDHPVVREGLRCLVERHGNGQIVGEADTAAEGIRLATTLRPEIVILDDSLPDLSSA